VLSKEIYLQVMNQWAAEYSYTLSDEILDLRYVGYKHLTDGQFKWVSLEAIKVCKGMPRVNEVLRLVEAEVNRRSVAQAKLTRDNAFHIAHKLSDEEIEKSKRKCDEELAKARGMLND